MHTFIATNKTEMLTIYAHHSIEAHIMAAEFLGLTNGRIKVVCIG